MVFETPALDQLESSAGGGMHRMRAVRSLASALKRTRTNSAGRRFHPVTAAGTLHFKQLHHRFYAAIVRCDEKL
jgi:hypothetical protein